MASKKFRFCCTLKDHDADVRGLANAVHEKGGILSCSRDKTTKLWIPENGSVRYESKSSYIGHKKFVSCVAAMEPIKGTYPYGLILTGSNDKVIHVYLPFDELPLFTLEGHENVVSSIKCGTDGRFYSSSWDQTARVWQLDPSQYGSGSCVKVLSGHSAAVWDIAVVPGTQLVLTASADKTVQLWERGATKMIYKGHSDCVRGLAVISSIQFLSCSNDATVKRWNMAGDCLQTYYGHKSFVYSVDLLPDAASFVTSGEDQAVKVWTTSSSNPQQTLPVPAISAWKVIALSNGDIAVGCSDGSIRIFSCSTVRAASETERAAYEEELAKLALPEAGMNLGDIDPSTLKGSEALQERGQKDGQTLLVRNSAVVEAYQWSVVEDKWIKVGDVVGSSGSNKSTYKGKEYDYVFTVDILEGAPPLHLPYNLDEDPWFAAQKFIDDNDLSQQFLDTVANFIIDNTKGAQALAPSVESTDPFTGQGRYMPSSSDSAKPQGKFDPFTGAGRYVPGSSTNGTTYGVNSAKLHDPMLNPSRYVPTDDDQPSAPKTKKMLSNENKYFPKFGFIFFETQNAVSMFNKLSANAKEAKFTLTNENISNLKALLSLISSAESIQIGSQTLWATLSWNDSLVLPALDLFRCALAAHKDFFELACGMREGDLITLLLSHLQTESVNVNKLLAVRILCNLFNSVGGQSFLLESFDMIMSSISNLVPTGNANNNLMVAISTLLINFAVAFNDKAAATTSSQSVEKMRFRCLEVCSAYLDAAALLGTEAMFRFLVSLGTLLYGHESAQEMASSIKLKSIVSTGTSIYTQTPKVVECGKFVLKLLN